MSKSITILDKDYKQWLKELSSRYRRSQIKAAIKVKENHGTVLRSAEDD